MPDSERHRSSWFFVEVRGPRSRRPVDVTLAAVGLLLVTLCAIAATHRGPFEHAAEDVAETLPDWARSLFEATYTLGAAYAIVIVAVVVFTAPRRGRLPLTLLVAVALSIGGAAVASFVVGDGWPDLLPAPIEGAADVAFPTVRVAAVTAALLVLRPWVTLTFRRLNAVIVTAECVAAWAIGIAGPPDALGALALGMLAAGATLVLLGSPGGHPDLAGVSDSLAALDIDVDGLRFAEQQPWGARVLYGTGPAGSPVLVRVFGRDAADAQRAARWWRAIFYRDQATPGATRLQMVEHEALVTLLAAREGVTVTPVLAAAESQGDALIVLGAPPPALVDDPTVDDSVLTDIWVAVAQLHRAGICHGELTLAKVGIANGELVFSGFGEGAVSTNAARRAQEVATLLTSQAVLVGHGRAVDTAVTGLGADRVAAAQPYLQKAALPRALRGVEGLKEMLEKLRDTITDRTGVAPQPPAEIARVRWRDLLQVGLILLAAYALLTTLVQLDWATVADSWANATWAWIVIGLVVAQCTSVADSVSTMSMVKVRLPLVPLMMLQYAVKFVGLAVSATLGRVALNTSFLSRFGQGPAVAVTASASDSFAGAVVNLLVFLIALPFLNDAPDVLARRLRRRRHAPPGASRDPGRRVRGSARSAAQAARSRGVGVHEPQGVAQGRDRESLARATALRQQPRLADDHNGVDGLHGQSDLPGPVLRHPPRRHRHGGALRQRHPGAGQRRRRRGRDHGVPGCGRGAQRSRIRDRRHAANRDLVPARGLRRLGCPLAAQGRPHQLTPALFADVPGRTVGCA